MKRNLFILALLSLMTLTLSACKKKKLTKDRWTITQATDLEDGSDITSDYTGEIWEFDKNGDYLENAIIKGTWHFSDDKEKLTITKLSNGNSDVYVIDKLTGKEMWLTELGDEEIKLSKYN